MQPSRTFYIHTLAAVHGAILHLILLFDPYHYGCAPCFIVRVAFTSVPCGVTPGLTFHLQIGTPAALDTHVLVDPPIPFLEASFINCSTLFRTFGTHSGASNADKSSSAWGEIMNWDVALVAGN
jgi:hypothetical protein